MSQKLALARLRSQFDSLAKQLSRPENAGRCLRRLSDWTAITDRSVPFALLERSVKDVVDGGFDAAAATNGVGVKKLKGLIGILERVCNDPVPVSAGLDTTSTLPSRSVFSASSARLRFASRPYLPLREVDWDRWRQVVADQGPADHPLGRYVAALRDIPRNAWTTPLKFYLNCSLSQLFALKLHGSRRVATIAETFGRVAEAVEAKQPCNGVRPEPILEFLTNLERLARPGVRRKAGNHDPLQPLREQIERDLGPQAGGIFLAIVGEYDRPSSAQAKVGSWTRYYRNSIARLIHVRCPEAAALVSQLTAPVKPRSSAPARVRLERLAELMAVATDD
jgi:hypothetical protein